jgi:hypothetical protein
MNIQIKSRFRALCLLFFVDLRHRVGDNGSVVEGGQPERDNGSVVEGGQPERDNGSVVEGGRPESGGGPHHERTGNAPCTHLGDARVSPWGWTLLPERVRCSRRSHERYHKKKKKKGLVCLILVLVLIFGLTISGLLVFVLILLLVLVLDLGSRSSSCSLGLVVFGLVLVLRP